MQLLDYTSNRSSPTSGPQWSARLRQDAAAIAVGAEQRVIAFDSAMARARRQIRMEVHSAAATGDARRPRVVSPTCFHQLSFRSHAWG
jgi:hypothetical protein